MDQELITEEERNCLLKIGLKMNKTLVLGEELTFLMHSWIYFNMHYFSYAAYIYLGQYNLNSCLRYDFNFLMPHMFS